MNIIFAIIILFSTFLLLLVDPSLVLPALSDSSGKAIELTLKLLSVYAVWMGILKLCDVTGVSGGLAKLLRPIIRFLYGDIKKETSEYLSINMAANILGMGDAATPAAIHAVNSMDEGSNTANFAMIMLVVINSTSLQILPTSIISLRQSFHSASATDIILPSFIASLVATLFGIALVMLIYKKATAPKKHKIK